RGLALTGNGQPFANMGIAVADYDGDGLTDLFVTHLGSETHTLWRQGPVGQFRDRTQDSRVVRTAWRGTGFGAVAADFDRDGWPDLLVVSVGDRARLYRNVAPGGHWLGVRVIDPARGKRELLGTVVRVTAAGRTWVQVAQSAHSYLSASDPRPLFGLGGATAY